MECYKLHMKFIFLLIILSAMAACSSVQQDTSKNVATTRTSSSIDSHDSSTVQSKILKQYEEWRGTPYKSGGLSKHGIDCSGFTYVTFRSKLGCTLPRTTRLQAKTGKKVSRYNLHAGDLVFFKTGLFVRHVGIYLGDSKFLHASTSKGVVISSLRETYWKKHFWTARRICS